MGVLRTRLVLIASVVVLTAQQQQVDIAFHHPTRVELVLLLHVPSLMGELQTRLVLTVNVALQIVRRLQEYTVPLRVARATRVRFLVRQSLSTSA